MAWHYADVAFERLSGMGATHPSVSDRLQQTVKEPEFDSWERVD